MAIGENKILVVDDEDTVRESLRLILSRNYSVMTAENGIQALSLLESIGERAGNADLPDLVILDVLMPGLDGLGLLEKLSESYPNIPVIMLTASTAVKNAVKAMKIGAVDYLSKPYDVEELLALIEATLGGETGNSSTRSHHHVQRIGLADIPGDFGCMVGSSVMMKELYRRIEQLAPRETTVLVCGESGTGKELVAKEIHRRSRRNAGPFIALNCAAIPESLIESELFGHEKGAFTHAIEKRIGHFELADKGTLFLDEIGELTLPVQVKMLRFLQQQEFYRVGCSKPIKVDVRVVAATNRSLDQAIQNGTFRQDLYYRVNVVSMEVPPLRERREDIPRLLEFFFNRFAPVYGGRRPTITPESVDLLVKYDWPGNVRELENTTESILALTTGNEVGVGDLPGRFRAQRTKGKDLKDDVLEGGLLFEEAEKAFEKEIIIKALARTNYIQTRAAELLGISRRILKYKMDKLGIADKPGES